MAVPSAVPSASAPAVHAPSRRGRFAFAACVLAATLVAAPARAADHWVTAWATAQQPVAQHPDTPAFNRAPDLAGRTVRQILDPRLAGDVWRVRVSNRYGHAPLTIDAASLAPAGRGAALAGPAQAVRFGGARSVTLAAGASRESDPIAVRLDAGPAALSLRLAAGAPTPGDWHKVASQVSYVANDGDHVQDAAGTAFHAGPTSWLFVDALLVQASDDARTAVAIGDSITDGMRSSLNANRRWPDALARRLATDPATARVAVVNLGISGNRLLNDSACYGEKLAARYPHDALDLPGGRYVIALIGINDINFPAMPKRRGLDCDEPHTFVSAADLEAGYRRLVDAAHRAHRLIYGATLTPADLPPEREAIRAAVNRWIRTSGAFDAVIDFDQAVRDPRHPQILIARYDSGDHIHPSDAGYQAMADAVPVALFTR